MKPYGGGRLFDEKRSPFGVALTPVQCIHYALTKPGVASVLCGYDTKEQVDAAVAYETAEEAEKDYASVLARAPRHSFSGGECTYCGHCRPCPAEIDIAMVNKLYDLAVMQPQVPASVREHYRALAHHAEECVGCRSCEERCPFGVKIAERMEKAAALFGC
jgi:predicted aldo/keto reductase-like oxidoreductase